MNSTSFFLFLPFLLRTTQESSSTPRRPPFISLSLINFLLFTNFAPALPHPRHRRFRVALTVCRCSHVQERAREMVQEGVDKYPGRAFRVPLMDSWIVVISGRGLVDELRAAREDELSFRQAAERVSFASSLPCTKFRMSLTSNTITDLPDAVHLRTEPRPPRLAAPRRTRRRYAQHRALFRGDLR